MLGARPGPVQPMITLATGNRSLNAASHTPPAKRVRTRANSSPSRWHYGHNKLEKAPAGLKGRGRGNSARSNQGHATLDSCYWSNEPFRGSPYSAAKRGVRATATTFPVARSLMSPQGCSPVHP